MCLKVALLGSMYMDRCTHAQAVQQRVMMYGNVKNVRTNASTSMALS